jgi:hypothetical protein
MKKTTLAAMLLLLGSCAAWGGTVCPAAGGANTFPHPPDPSATGCNVVITVNANGTTTVTVTDATPYELSEDVLVGVVNNSGSTVTSLALTGSDIFGFDGDGICTFTFVGSSYCSGTYYKTDPGDYAGPTNTFTVTNGNSGTVNFSPGIAPGGGTAYFSLEGVPTVSLGVTVGTGPGSPVPALSTWGLVLLTVLLMGLSVIRLLKRA